jgi:hypothetical protein|tara:strand:- start:125 stop:322 length:198 start_codon:yes stop_codon:yes gene_type:complete
MSKDDLQKTNVADSKPVTVDDVRKAIIGDENKFLLLNVFNNLMQENQQLKAELEASRKANNEANV